MLFSQAFRSGPPRASVLPVLSRPYRNFYRGKRPTCYRNRRHSGKRYRCVFLYSVHKETSLRGKMKKMGSRHFRLCYFFEVYFASRHYATRVAPFFFLSYPQRNGLNEGLFTRLFNGARRMGFLSKSVLTENGWNEQRIRGKSNMKLTI